MEKKNKILNYFQKSNLKRSTELVTTELETSKKSRVEAVSNITSVVDPEPETVSEHVANDLS